ncbi:hypothetical protein EVAR_85146_1 [Eumeta japonica]|uniref:Uncharacterized protein n=1 Tax=Eumeta variegata TaxID=151549 RepID=A0A4C1XQU8_EUMVA|nr:hypothetical protein EVAR_85146_1 [Eumeta japonica]
MLNPLQHSIGLKACRAYRTVSLHSALNLAKLLPLDIRVREAAKLYEVKREKELGDICADRELERSVDFRELPHPAHTPEFGFESVVDLDPGSTMARLAIVGPHICTNGSKIEGKIGSTLIEWRDGMEFGNSAYRLESFCTAFQAEMFRALHRAIRRVKKGKDRLAYPAEWAWPSGAQLAEAWPAELTPPVAASRVSRPTGGCRCCCRDDKSSR